MKLGRIVTAMITPFDKRGEVDYQEAGRIATWLVDRGNDGTHRGNGEPTNVDKRTDQGQAVKMAL